jgi:hypothetical protein
MIKKNITTLFILCIAAAIWGIGALMSIKNASGVALPITIVTATPDTIVIVTQYSRNGAARAVEKDATTATWTITKWTSKVVVTTRNANETIRLRIGNSEIVTKTANEQNEVVFSTETTPYTQSAIPYFAPLINWPGDISAIITSLKQSSSAPLLSLMVMVLLYCLYRKSKHLPLRTLHPNALAATQLACMFSISIVTWLSFALHAPTAFDWPAADMAQYWERSSNPNFLPHDFYTNASMDPNPRHLFGHIILGMNTFFGTTWYESLFVLKSLLVFLVPLSIFLGLTSYRRSLPPAERITYTCLITTGILFCYIPQFLAIFSFALWYPFQIQATPHVASLTLVFCAIALVNYERRVLGAILWSIATLLHPSVGLFGLFFHVILQADRNKIKENLVLFGVSILIPIYTIKKMYASDTSLSGANFVYYYITNSHWFHYLPTQLSSNPLSPFPWYVHFSLCVAIIALLGYASYKIRETRLVITAILAITAFISVIVISYLGLEVFTIREIAIIGPTRFFIFTYWCILFLGAAVLTSLATPYMSRWYGYIPATALPTQKVSCIFICSIIIICIAGGSNHLQDDPFTQWKQDNSTLADWIATTNEQSTFATYDFTLSQFIPLALNRSVFSAAGFPFSEAFFHEHYTRRSFLFGNSETWQRMPGRLVPTKANIYYESLTLPTLCNPPNDYPLDYVIFSNDFIGNDFRTRSSDFQNENFTIYNLNTLCATL